MPNFGRIAEYFEKIVDWTCLDKLKLRKIVITVLIFEFISSVFLLIPTMVVHFTFVNKAGKAGFVDGKWLNHTDLFAFRRQQPWELEHPIDWDVGRRLFINKTRYLLDQACSVYDNNVSIPGDPGDYLKEVAGHPNLSGYNKNLQAIIKLWTASISILYFSCPFLLLSLWWKKQAGRLIGFYLFLQLFPMFLLVSALSISRTHLMCAVEIIFDHIPVNTYLFIFIVILWIYEFFKLVMLVLYCMEQRLSRKRKFYGFRRRGSVKGGRPRKVGPGTKDKKGATDDKTGKPGEDEGEFDVEKYMQDHKKSMKKTAQSTRGQNIARELLEMGTTTQEDTEAEDDAAPPNAQEIRKSLKGKKSVYQKARSTIPPAKLSK